MLAKAFRLTKQKDFTSMFHAAKNFQSKELVLRLQERGGNGVRAGVIVSKKSAKKAVARNRLKRIIRETLRRLIPSIPEGIDLVVITRPGADRMEEKRILASLQSLVERALPRKQTSLQ